jgi:hypothetical protein
MPERKAFRSIHRREDSSRVRTLAERPRLSATLISPTISSGSVTNMQKRIQISGRP